MGLLTGGVRSSAQLKPGGFGLPAAILMAAYSANSNLPVPAVVFALVCQICPELFHFSFIILPFCTYDKIRSLPAADSATKKRRGK